MENEINNQEEVQVEQKSQLHQVTPLSKYLAMALFIIMPFVGGWIGYTYAPEKVVEVEKVVVKEVTQQGTREEVSHESEPYFKIDTAEATYTNEGDYWNKDSTVYLVTDHGPVTLTKMNSGNCNIEKQTRDKENLVSLLKDFEQVSFISSEEIISGVSCAGRRQNFYELYLLKDTVNTYAVIGFANDPTGGSGSGQAISDVEVLYP